MKTHARFLIFAISIILVAGCDLFDSGSSKDGPAQPSLIARLDLANAHSLAVAGVGSTGGSSFSASSSGQGTVLLKFDEVGNFEPVVHYDPAGNPMGVPNPLEARNINDDWIALFTVTGRLSIPLLKRITPMSYRRVPEALAVCPKACLTCVRLMGFPAPWEAPVSISVPDNPGAEPVHPARRRLWQ